jgi:hypothetical protein
MGRICSIRFSPLFKSSKPQPSAVDDSDWEHECPGNQKPPQPFAEARKNVREPSQHTSQSNGYCPHESTLKLQFILRWVTVVLYLDPRRDCVDDVILRCLPNNKQTVGYMGQSLLSIG